MSAQIRIEREGRIATVLLDGPERHNVLSGSGWMELARVFTLLTEDESLDCVVVRGVGGRAFSAGSDIALFSAQRDTVEDAHEYSVAISDALEAIRGCSVPVVAIIQGLCVGGGLEIAACCDIRVCGTSSRFGAPINRLGLTMAHEELWPLILVVGPAVLLDLLLTGDLIDADAALRVGFVSRIFPDDDVLSAGYAVADRVAAGAPLVNRWHKKFVRQLVDPYPVSPVDEIEALESFRTADYREGRAAFLEKRSPNFQGR